MFSIRGCHLPRELRAFPQEAEAKIFIFQTNLDQTGVITFLNGEISQIATSDGNTDDYTYDNKNNPFKNVLGYNKIYFTDALTDGVVNNVVTMTSSSTGGSYVNTNTYNANDFIHTSESVSNVETISSEFFYNR